MNILKNVTKSITDAVDYVVEKNKVNAKLNRLKIVMRHEAKILTKSYVKLGKYYYENLRDSANEENKALCESIDISLERLKKAQEKYTEYKNISDCCCSKPQCSCDNNIVKTEDIINNPIRETELNISEVSVKSETKDETVNEEIITEILTPPTIADDDLTDLVDEVEEIKKTSKDKK